MATCFTETRKGLEQRLTMTHDVTVTNEMSCWNFLLNFVLTVFFKGEFVVFTSFDYFFDIVFILCI